MWPGSLPNDNVLECAESSFQATSIRASLRIVKAGWGDLSGSVIPAGERLFPGFAVHATSLIFRRTASVIFEDFSQASASPARYRWLNASGGREACRIVL